MKSLLLPVALLSAVLNGTLARDSGRRLPYYPSSSSSSSSSDEHHDGCSGCNVEKEDVAEVNPVGEVPPVEEVTPVEEVAPTATGNVIQVARSMPETFSTVLSLTTKAGMAGDLRSATFGSTVFAPNNEAWVAFDALNLPSANTRVLSADRDWMVHLQDLLDYHVIDGAETLAVDVVDGSRIAMRNGEECSFTNLNGVTINEATVIAADVTANNGKLRFARSGGFKTPSHSHDLVCFCRRGSCH